MLKWDKEIQNFLLTSLSKSLATNGRHGLNVVPVSSLEVIDDQIWLFDFFMNKTAQNIESEAEVALVCWTGAKGYQFKGKAQQFYDGEQFDAALAIAAIKFPNRKLQGLIIITVNKIWNVSIENND